MSISSLPTPTHSAGVAPKREVTPNRLRRTLYWMTQDWIYLSGQLPVPSSVGGRSSNVKTWGHPAEWASDQCRKIADIMWSWHNLIAEMHGESRPRPMYRAGVRVRTEQSVIVAAWKYLEPRLEWMLALEGWVPADEVPVPWREYWDWTISDEAFAELFELHGHVRARTGHSRPRTALPLPCPNSECGMLTLERVPGMKGQDFIQCGSCDYQAKDSHYPFLVKLMLDTQISGGRGE